MATHPVTENIITNLNDSLSALQRTLGSLGEEEVKKIREDADQYLRRQIEDVRIKMEQSDKSQTAQIAQVNDLFKKVFEEELGKELEKLIKAEVLQEIDDLVKAEVAERLPEYLPPDLLDEMLRHETQLAKLEKELHNSESARANAMLRLSDLEQPIQPLYNTKGEISPEFPKRLVDLFNMTNETAVTLLRDYAPNDKPTDSRDSNVNAVMRICGVRFVLLSFNGGPSIPCSPTAAARANGIA